MRMNLFTTPNGSGAQRCILCPNHPPFKSGLPARQHAQAHVRAREAANDGTAELPRWVIVCEVTNARLVSDRLAGDRLAGDRLATARAVHEDGGLEPPPSLAHATPRARVIDGDALDDEDEAHRLLADDEDGPVHELNFDHGGR